MQCRRCGKIFNYDIYYGICPKCAYFNRPDGKEALDYFEEDNARFERNEEYRMPEQEDTHKQLHKRYDTDETPHKIKKKRKSVSWEEKERQNARRGSSKIIMLVVSIFLAVVCAGGIFGILAYDEELFMEETEAIEEATYVEETEDVSDVYAEENYLLGEELVLPDERTIVFGEVQVVNDEQLTSYLPEEKKLIRISVRLEEPEEYERMSTFYDVPCVKNSDLYCYPVDPDMTDDPEKYAELLEDNVDYPEMMDDDEEGWMYYVVDESLVTSEIYWAAWEEYPENEMPDYVWKISFDIEEAADE